MNLKILKITTTAKIPEYKTSGSAGLDLSADLFGRTTSPELPLYSDSDGLYLYLLPGSIVLVPTGLAMAIQEGYEGQLRPRSGLTLKQQLTVPNSPGTVDSDYRGEIKVVLHNFGTEPRKVRHQQRIAQIVINKVEHAQIEVVKVLEETERGTGGFGSTGV